MIRRAGRGMEITTESLKNGIIGKMSNVKEKGSSESDTERV
jgi:hypothetical protein